MVGAPARVGSDGGGRRRDRPPALVRDDVNGQIVQEVMSTGAVVAGRRTFEWAGGWGGDHHNGVPIFIYSHLEPGIHISRWPLVTYVDDVETAMTRAREAAGGEEHPGARRGNRSARICGLDVRRARAA